MTSERLPLLRGRVHVSQHFKSPLGGDRTPKPLPSRNPAKHKTTLLQQLDHIAEQAKARPVGQRDELATREVIAVTPEPGYELKAESLADKKTDHRVVVRDDQTGVVIVDAPSPELKPLRKKVLQFADDEKVSEKGARRNAPAVAPIGSLNLASEGDLAGPRLRAAQLEPGKPYWFEIGCRGGYRRPEAETVKSRQQIVRQLKRIGHDEPQDFEATEQVVFFARLTLEQVRALIDAVDCVYEVDLAPPDLRDWQIYEHQSAKELRSFELTPPAENAPAVVIMDTGVATKHPLLENAIRSSQSVVAEDNSPEDQHGHGTEMAGTAIYDDLGAAVENGHGAANHWLQSIKLLTRPYQGSAERENRPYWPSMTVRGTEQAEAAKGQAANQVFTLAVTSPLEPLEPTFWSHAIDQLSFNMGSGRLLVVCTGNADVGDARLLEGYPQLNLDQKLEEPAQSANCLTVGAYTAKTRVAPSQTYAELAAVAPAGGISPHTRAGVVGTPGPVKPDVVLEGGNVATDGQLPDPFVETLTTLTTGKDHLTKPLSLICMTSEATARAARFAANIWSVDPSLRPETVRGLMVHSASWTPAMVEQFPNIDERMAVCGYGVPSLPLARECARDRATVIIEGEMPNAVLVEEPKAKPPKRPDTKQTDTKKKRLAKFFRLPVPEDLLLQDPNQQVELRVTLSYFAEPNTFRRQVYRGLDLKWDMQGSQETEEQFQRRINALLRTKGAKKDWDESFPWDIKITRRSRGTVQSDRWTGAASFLAGPKLIGVYPVLGWWDQRALLETASMPFSLIVTVQAAGLDIYNPIATALKAVVDVTV